MKTISVLIQHHAGPTGDVLICRNAGGAWEFPHDRERTNETDAATAVRIAAEQLGMTVSVGKLITRGRHKPQDGKVEHLAEGNITHNTHTKDDYHLYYEAVNTWQTEPKAGTYAEFLWVHPSELAEYGFEGDDANFMKKYAPWVAGQFIPDVRMY